MHSTSNPDITMTSLLFIVALALITVFLVLVLSALDQLLIVPPIEGAGPAVLNGTTPDPWVPAKPAIRMPPTPIPDPPKVLCSLGAPVAAEPALGAPQPLVPVSANHRDLDSLRDDIEARNALDDLLVGSFSAPDPEPLPEWAKP